MKTLGKQLIQSFLLGAVMPALIIGGMVQRNQENNEDVQNVPSTETLAFMQENADEFLSMTHTSFIPVLDSSGTVRMTELEEYIVQRYSHQNSMALAQKEIQIMVQDIKPIHLWSIDLL